MNFKKTKYKKLFFSLLLSVGVFTIYYLEDKFHIETIINTAIASSNDEKTLNDNYNRYVENFDITVNDQTFNGHTISKHIGRTESDMITRLAESPAIVSASSFENIEIANKAIKKTLQKNTKEVIHWLYNRNDKKSLRLQENMDFNLGKVIPKDTNQPIQSTNIVVILKRIRNNSFFVVTAFPILDPKHE